MPALAALRLSPSTGAARKGPIRVGAMLAIVVVRLNIGESCGKALRKSVDLVCRVAELSLYTSPGICVCASNHGAGFFRLRRFCGGGSTGTMGPCASSLPPASVAASCIGTSGLKSSSCCRYERLASGAPSIGCSSPMGVAVSYSRSNRLTKCSGLASTPLLPEKSSRPPRKFCAAACVGSAPALPMGKCGYRPAVDGGSMPGKLPLDAPPPRR
mmetsp:Transcript_99600/g.197448  ORF Transcript_99600/g.197448 Transcript_99600/m.197448 type:complete len:214 (-) Transcript_99600:678-1319(-)